jgi:hypothetical protein
MGSLSFDNYDYSKDIDKSFKGSYINLGILSPPNFSYFFFFVSITVGVVLKLLHRYKWKDSKTLEIMGSTFMIEYAFYSLVFSAYFIFSRLIIGVILIGNGGPENIMNTALSAILTIVIGIYCVGLIRSPQ